MRVPFVDLARDHDELAPAIERVVVDVLRSGQYVLGPSVESFEEAFATFCETEHCVTVSTGTAALHLALLALGVGPGDEVVTVASSFIATAEAIAYTGATPIFADVELKTGNIDCAALESAITPSTKAIVVVHLYGQPADMGTVLEIAGRHRVPVLEDAAQAHGARWRGKRVGSLATAACFSFYPTKNLGASGEGGAIVTGDARLADTVRRLRDHGQDRKYIHGSVGYNYRLDELQAAILGVRLTALDERNERRRTIAERYRQQLGDLPLDLPHVVDDTEAVHHLFVVRSRDRERVKRALASTGIATAIHYPVPIHLQPAFSFLGHGPGDLPVTERRADEILSLPIFPQLTTREQDDVVAAVRQAVA
jgi:dTDP-4-amino-4,6-dideoxygalactose transaminase